MGKNEIRRIIYGLDPKTIFTLLDVKHANTLPDDWTLYCMRAFVKRTQWKEPIRKTTAV
jgi:hypothetical protein